MEIACPPPLYDKPSPRPSGKKGGWRAVRYILANESFEKLASMSLIMNMTLYLKTMYNMDTMESVNVVNIWNGSSNFATLIGAFIADAIVGRYFTLLFASFATLSGMLMMTLTAGVSQLRPPTCSEVNNCPPPRRKHLGFLFTALGLLVVGAGGIRPSNIAFGADQFDTKSEKGRKQLASFFNWWYFLFTISLLVALLGVVYVQTNLSWVFGFGIPAVCLAFSILIFLIGAPLYVRTKANGSVFADMAKVFVSSWRKRKLVPRLVAEQSFYNPESDSGYTVTNRFRCLEKGAIISNPSELNEEGKPSNSWRLCSLQHVEELKSVIAVLPVWFSGIACLIAMDQQSTFGTLQGLQMDSSIGPHNFHIPPAWMNLSAMTALAIWILAYEKVYLPLSKKIFKRERRLTMLQRLNIGIIMSVLSMLVSGCVEIKRRESALKRQSFVSPESILWLLPQYILSGLTEAFSAVALMEFLNTEMPQRLKTVSGAIFFLGFALASYLNSIIMNIFKSAAIAAGKSPWLEGSDLNKNRLEYHYFAIAGLGALNYLYFVSVARRYIVNSSGSKS